MEIAGAKGQFGVLLLVGTRLQAHSCIMSEENRIDPPVVVSPPLRQSLPRTLLRLAIVVVVALVLREAYGWFEDQAKTLDVVSQTRECGYW